MRQSHLILSNALIIWVCRVLLLVPQLILVPYLIGTIGEDGYGIYALVWSLMMSIDQLEKSLQSGVVKYSAGYLAQKHIDDTNKIISSSFIYSLLLAVIASIVIFSVTPLFDESSGRIVYSLFVVGIMILFIIPMTPYIAIIQSLQFYYIGAISNTISKYLSLALIFIWFKFISPSVESLVIIMVTLLFFSRFIQIPIAYRFIPGLKNRLSLFDKNKFKLIFSFGGATVIASLCLAFNYTGVRWLMNSLVSTAFVAHLAIMLMPKLLMEDLIGAVTLTAMPAASAYEALGNREMLKQLLVKGMRYTSILIYAGIIAAGLLLKSVLKIWVGSEYEFFAPYAFILFASAGFMLTTSIAHHILKGLGKLKIVVFIYFLGFVFIPILLIFFVLKIWDDPYFAVTVGLASGYFICGSLNLIFCAKTVNAPLLNIIPLVYIQPFIIAISVCLPIIVLFSCVDFESIFIKIIVAIFGIILYFGGCYFFIASNNEKKHAIEYVKMIRKKILSIRNKI